MGCCYSRGEGARSAASDAEGFTLRDLMDTSAMARFHLRGVSRHFDKRVEDIHKDYCSRLSVRFGDTYQAEKMMQQATVLELGRFGWLCVLYEYTLNAARGTVGKGDLVFVMKDGERNFRALVVETKVLTGAGADKQKPGKVAEQARTYGRLVRDLLRRDVVSHVYSVPLLARKDQLHNLFLPRAWPSLDAFLSGKVPDTWTLSR